MIAYLGVAGHVLHDYVLHDYVLHGYVSHGYVLHGHVHKPVFYSSVKRYFSMIALRCPLCFLPLASSPQGLACSQRHQFDRAREGYWNLLPVHHKGSKEPGDAPAQLQARRRFLQAGYYHPLRDGLLHCVPGSLSGILDIGCGEGFFTQAMALQQPGVAVLGIDIAKTGVRMAARAAQSLPSPSLLSASLHYAVASSFALPVMDASVDLVTRVFAPSQPDELLRALRPGGWLLLAVPAQQHLLGLRQKIYTQVRPHPEPVAPPGFQLQQEERVSASIELAGDDLAALLAMTPFAWRLAPELRQALVEQGLQDRLDVSFLRYQKI